MATAKLKCDRKKLFQDIMVVLHKLGELKCSYCGGGFTYADEATTPTLDHIIPLSMNGSNHISNLTPCCKKCNSSKKSRIIKVKFQNYGFGVQGSVKREYPLAWQSSYDILTIVQRRYYRHKIKTFFTRITNFFKRRESNEKLSKSN